MKLSWAELVSNAIGEELTPEQEEELKEAMGEALGSLSFEDVSSSLKKEYPNATKKDLENAITMKEDGYEIAYHELPPQPFEQELKSMKRSEIPGVSILTQRDADVCHSCRPLDGKEYTIEEALEKEPLPHDECENDRCRCTYTPLSDAPDQRTSRFQRTKQVLRRVACESDRSYVRL